MSKKFTVHNSLPREVKDAPRLPLASDEFDEDIVFGYTPAVEADEYEVLMECAAEWLPATPQVCALIDNGIALDYGVLVSARIAVEEFENRISEDALDDMLAALLVYGEEDALERMEFTALMSPSAQYMVAQMELAMKGSKGRGIAEAPLEARQLLWLGVLSDLTVAHEVFEETGDAAALDDMQLSGKLFALMSEQGDMPDHLVEQALGLFNELADISDLPLRVTADREIVTLHDDTPPPAPKNTAPKPPKR